MKSFPGQLAAVPSSGSEEVTGARESSRPLLLQLLRGPEEEEEVAGEGLPRGAGLKEARGGKKWAGGRLAGIKE